VIQYIDFLDAITPLFLPPPPLLATLRFSVSSFFLRFSQKTLPFPKFPSTLQMNAVPSTEGLSLEMVTNVSPVTSLPGSLPADFS
jgi:hypothetical protein